MDDDYATGAADATRLNHSSPLSLKNSMDHSRLAHGTWTTGVTLRF
jgi:hypothetical protein